MRLKIFKSYTASFNFEVTAVLIKKGGKKRVAKKLKIML